MRVWLVKAAHLCSFNSCSMWEGELVTRKYTCKMELQESISTFWPLQNHWFVPFVSPKVFRCNFPSHIETHCQECVDGQQMKGWLTTQWKKKKKDKYVGCACWGTKQSFSLLAVLTPRKWVAISLHRDYVGQLLCAKGLGVHTRLGTGGLN